MENAAKALTIAGGVLIAIIVVATLWYSFQQWGILPQAKDDNEKISQEVEFNKEFESYNKQNLYGTDIITVINKAMANNEKYGITAELDDPYYVDVKFSLKTDVYGYTKEYKRENDIEISERKINNETPFLYALPKKYSLKTDFNDLYNLCQNDPVKVTQTKKGNVFTRKEVYSKEEDFKLRYFTCTGIEYDPTNGRVSSIEFEELSVDELHRI